MRIGGNRGRRRAERPRARWRLTAHVLIAIGLTTLGMIAACASGPAAERPRPAETAPAAARAAPGQADRSAERERMVERQIRARGVRDPRVLEAMRAVPRHRFVPPPLQDRAYDDAPLPIGLRQTISQPYVVAYMTEALELPPDAAVLEIGTGSGYQAAVLAEIARTVRSIEIVPELAERSARVLADLGYDNVRLRTGDGYRGWPEAAPFDGIMVTAAPDHVPPALVEQLAVGARLVIPVGQLAQEIRIVTRTADGPVTERALPVRFVPMTGEAEQR